MSLTHQQLGYVNPVMLPRTLQDLIDLIGIDATYQLVERWGGTTKYIPKCRFQESELRLVLGDDTVLKLAMAYGGENLELPKADHFEHQVRDQMIMEYSNEGASRRELAMKFGISIRQIGNIRRRYRTGKHSS